MPRIKVVTTPISSPEQLVAALGQLGFQQVESHAAPQMLCNWMGKPTHALAEVIVRRLHIGVASDDLGFTRNAHGTFDALLSEMHLLRFNRRWLEDLARRHDELTAARGQPPHPLRADPRCWAEHTLALGVPGAPPVAAAAAHALTDRAADRARREVNELVEQLDAARLRSAGRASVLLVLPVLLWGAQALDSQRMRAWSILAGYVLFALVLYGLAAGSRRSAHLRRAAAAFRKRFPSESPDHAAALAELEEMLRPGDKRSDSGAVRKLFTAVRPRLVAARAAQASAAAQRPPRSAG